jgi:hypothetical protein
MSTAYLSPKFDPAKSFYNKATVTTETDGTQTLHSYGVKVAQIKKGKLSLFGYHSLTTGRHINEFLQQNGLEKLTKSEILDRVSK